MGSKPCQAQENKTIGKNKNFVDRDAWHMLQYRFDKKRIDMIQYFYSKYQLMRYC